MAGAMIRIRIRFMLIRKLSHAHIWRESRGIEGVGFPVGVGMVLGAFN